MQKGDHKRPQAAAFIKPYSGGSSQLASGSLAHTHSLTHKTGSLGLGCADIAVLAFLEFAIMIVAGWRGPT